MSSFNDEILRIANEKGWQAIPLKYVFKRRKQFAQGTEELLSIYRDHGVVPKSSRTDNFNKPSDDLTKYQVVKPGDLVVNKMKAWQGSVAISEYGGIISPAYFIYEPVIDIYPRYVHYLLRSDFYTKYYLSISSGIRPNQWDLDPAMFGRILLLVPSKSEQITIANKLDNELAEIDGLIADQQRLKSLLEERLSSLTFELATDASNSNRYETGHPFWKTLPKGWTLQKLGWHFKVGNGSTPKSDNPEYWTDNPDEGFPWFNSSVVNYEVAMTPARYVTDEALAECHLPFIPAGSLLVGLTGQGKTRGMVTKTGIESTINQHIAYLAPRAESRITIEFAMLCLQAAYPELRFISDGNGSTKGALTCDQIINFQIPAPSKMTQKEIINLRNNFEPADIVSHLISNNIKLLDELKKSTAQFSLGKQRNSI